MNSSLYRLKTVRRPDFILYTVVRQDNASVRPPVYIIYGKTSQREREGKQYLYLLSVGKLLGEQSFQPSDTLITTRTLHVFDDDKGIEGEEKMTHLMNSQYGRIELL